MEAARDLSAQDKLRLMVRSATKLRVSNHAGPDPSRMSWSKASHQPRGPLHQLARDLAAAGTRYERLFGATVEARERVAAHVGGGTLAGLDGVAHLAQGRG